MTAAVLWYKPAARRSNSDAITTTPFSFAILPSVSVVGPGTGSARSKSAWSSRWAMYMVRNSSGRHTRSAPCCAASRMRATALARFASGSSLMLICTSPTLYCDGVPFDPELMGKKICQNVLLADRTIPSLPTSSVSCHGKGLDDHAAAERAARSGGAAQIRPEIGFFAVLAEVESCAFLGHICPRADRHLNELEDPEGAEAGKGDGGQYREQLDAHLPGIAREESIAAGGIHELSGEHARQERSRGSSEAVAGEHVERVVELGPRPDLDGRVTDAGRQHTDEEPGHRRHVPGRRC